MTLFADLAALLETLANQNSRLKKRAAIAQAMAAVHAGAPHLEPEMWDSQTPAAASLQQESGADAGLFALYLAGTPFAEADSRKLNAGGALLTRALLAVSGATDAALTAAYRRHGDLGAAAFDLLSQPAPAHQQKKSASLTLADVSEAFAAISTARTTASRAALVESLLRRATPLEAKYLLKLMLGDMRIGVKQSLVEEAIAFAASTPASPVSPAQVRHAVMLEADLSRAVQRAFNGTLGEARMRLFHPLGFMLASPVDSPEEAIARFTTASDSPNGERTTENVQPAVEAFLEDKYDGIRAQIHCGDPESPGRVALYSRNREDITESFPELAEAFANVDQATTGALIGPLILDGEILAWNFGTALETWGRSNGADVQSPAVLTREARPEPHEVPEHALPFAVLGQRIGRKRVSNEMRARIPVIFMAFDLLCANGELILDQPLRDRRNHLEAIAERLVPHTISPLELAAPEPAQSHLFQLTTSNQQLTTASPRLMLSPARLVESAEDIDRAYLAARARSNEGVMIKAADSTYQPGRRGLAWLKLKRELATLDVVITGAEYGHGKRAGLLSDYTFAVRGPNSELLNVGKAYSGVTDAEIAELTAFLKAHTLEDQGHFRLVEPLIILEVAFNNIMRSPRHASGFALRFPRILRLRPDKPLVEIDTLARVEEIYQSQVDKPVESSEPPA
jgi:DNA ligase 1